MIPVICRQVEVFLFRRRARRAEFLLLRRAPSRSLAGIWQPVTGGIEQGEPAFRAAAREVLEETSLRPIRWWALERLTMFYDPARDAIAAVPVFAAEVAWTDPVHLSHEHDRYAFGDFSATSKRMLWDTQRQALAAVRSEVLAGGANAAARDVTARLAALPRAATKPRPAARRTAVPRPRRRAGA